MSFILFVSEICVGRDFQVAVVVVCFVGCHFWFVINWLVRCLFFVVILFCFCGLVGSWALLLVSSCQTTPRGPPVCVWLWQWPRTHARTHARSQSNIQITENVVDYLPATTVLYFDWVPNKCMNSGRVPERNVWYDILYTLCRTSDVVTFVREDIPEVPWTCAIKQLVFCVLCLWSIDHFTSWIASLTQNFS